MSSGQVIAGLMAVAALTLAGCKKEPPKKLTAKEREAAMALAVRQQDALNLFVTELRKVVAQSQTAQDTAALVKQLQALPVGELPVDVATAWSEVLAAWQQRVAGQTAGGAEVSQRLNQALRAHGVMDLEL